MCWRSHGAMRRRSHHFSGKEREPVRIPLPMHAVRFIQLHSSFFFALHVTVSLKHFCDVPHRITRCHWYLSLTSITMSRSSCRKISSFSVLSPSRGNFIAFFHIALRFCWWPNPSSASRVSSRLIISSARRPSGFTFDRLYFRLLPLLYFRLLYFRLFYFKAFISDSHFEIFVINSSHSNKSEPLLVFFLFIFLFFFLEG